MGFFVAVAMFFLWIAAVVASFRLGGLLIKWINSGFDWLGGKKR